MSRRSRGSLSAIGRARIHQAAPDTALPFLYSNSPESGAGHGIAVSLQMLA
ncbi:hypothetical protein QUB68_08165 [Microcoleus sp. A006_D1]|uniref:hypothetical protein n=1 Tax=Microcoleus sp. A006_D1 TaxID=3055267 RepID=UPI002FD216FF